MSTWWSQVSSCDAFSLVSLGDSALCPSFDSSHKPWPASVLLERGGGGPCLASPISSHTASHPCCLQQVVAEGGPGWTGTTGYPSVPLQWVTLPHPSGGPIPLTKPTTVDLHRHPRVGEGEEIWSRKRNPADEPGRGVATEPPSAPAHLWSASMEVGKG